MWSSLKVKAGHFEIDLDEESSPEPTQTSTVPGDSSEFPIQLDDKISEECTPTILSFEVESSSDEVEIIEETIIPADKVVEFTEILPPQLEIEKMKQEERYGFLYRVRDRQAYVDERVRGVVQAIADESPEDRKARRKSFQEAVFGKFQ